MFRHLDILGHVWVRIILVRSLLIMGYRLIIFRKSLFVHHFIKEFGRKFSGNALGIWICGCSLIYKRELLVSKTAGAHITKSLKISGCKRWCPNDLRVRAPVLTHSLILHGNADVWNNLVNFLKTLWKKRLSHLDRLLLKFNNIFFCIS